MHNGTTSSYTPPENITGDRLVIGGEEFSHLTRVLRRKAGDTLRVVDGRGMEYDAEIERAERRLLRCRITGRRRAGSEPSIHLTLGVALLKNSARFDILVEKATELGVSSIVPLTTARTIAAHARTDRWTRIAVSAMVQSGRAVLPEILPLTPMEEFLESTPAAHLRLIAHELTGTLFLPEVPLKEHVVVAVGPEGGFSEEEVTRARTAGFQPVGLGARRLRTETAAVSAAALILCGRRDAGSGRS